MPRPNLICDAAASQPGKTGGITRLTKLPSHEANRFQGMRFGVASATALKSSWPARGRVFVKCDSVTRRCEAVS
jgi:hypothetical protein